MNHDEVQRCSVKRPIRLREEGLYSSPAALERDGCVVRFVRAECLNRGRKEERGEACGLLHESVACRVALPTTE